MPASYTETAGSRDYFRRARAGLTAVALLLAVYAIAGLSGNAAAADAGASALVAVADAGASALVAVADAGASAVGLQNFVTKTVPAPLPEVQFQDAAGQFHNLAEYKGKIVLVNFWATWCAPCRAEMPSLDRLQQALGGPDFTVVIISLDRAGYAKAAEFLNEIGVKNLTSFVDPGIKAARKLGALGLPVTLLLNRKGDEIGRMTGPAEWDQAPARALILPHIEAR